MRKQLLVVALFAVCAPSATAGEAKLLPEGASLGAGFGTSIATQGELLVIGAPGDRGGSVHVYSADGRYWRLTPNEAPIISSFGRAVGVDGNVIVVGAPSEGAGAFYIFRFNGVTWSQEFKVKLGSGSWYFSFGTAVAVSGNRVVASSPTHTYDGRIEGTGLAAFYRYDGTGWVWETTVTTYSRNDAFGRSVALQGNTAVVAGNQKLLVYVHNGTSWHRFAGAAFAFRRLGASVATTNGTVLAGAPQDDQLGTAVGAVYIFTEPWPVPPSNGNGGGGKPPNGGDGPPPGEGPSGNPGKSSTVRRKDTQLGKEQL